MQGEGQKVGKRKRGTEGSSAPPEIEVWLRHCVAQPTMHGLQTLVISRAIN